MTLLVAVVDAGSVTGAAQRLGVTQSAVRHPLDKLRAITGEPLFVTSGRGIVATARAEALAEPCPPLPMYMIWHVRHQVDAAHRWLRGELEGVVQALLAHEAHAAQASVACRWRRVGRAQRRGDDSGANLTR